MSHEKTTAEKWEAGQDPTAVTHHHLDEEKTTGEKWEPDQDVVDERHDTVHRTTESIADDETTGEKWRPDQDEVALTDAATETRHHDAAVDRPER